MTRVGRIRAVLCADPTYGKLYSKTKNGTKTYIKKIFEHPVFTVVPQEGPITRLENSCTFFGQYVNTYTLYKYNKNGVTRRMVTNTSGCEPNVKTKTIANKVMHSAHGAQQYSGITFSTDTRTNELTKIHSRINMDRCLSANKTVSIDSETGTLKEKIKIKYEDKNHQAIKFIDCNKKNWGEIIHFFNFLKKLDMR